jgi:hypothetical protein
MISLLLLILKVGVGKKNSAQGFKDSEATSTTTRCGNCLTVAQRVKTTHMTSVACVPHNSPPGLRLVF